MTSFKTIAATVVITVGGTVAAFGGLHLGQAPADAATGAWPTKAASTAASPAAQYARAMHGQDAVHAQTTHRRASAAPQTQPSADRGGQVRHTADRDRQVQRSATCIARHDGDDTRAESRTCDGQHRSTHQCWDGDSHSGAGGGGCW